LPYLTIGWASCVPMLQGQKVFKPHVWLACCRPDLSPTFHYVNVVCLTFNEHIGFVSGCTYCQHTADIGQEWHRHIEKVTCISCELLCVFW
jgi:hypothetical protein